MTYKAKTLKNMKLGITEFDIKECNDEIQLLEWKMEINKDIAEIGNQINMAKANASNGEYSDLVWFANAIGAKKCQGMLDQTIALRLRTLREAKIEANKEEKEDLLQRFVEVAQEELSEKVFLKLLKKAQTKSKTKV